MEQKPKLAETKTDVALAVGTAVGKGAVALAFSLLLDFVHYWRWLLI